MLQIRSFTFNPFQENTYIITNEHNDCWIVDPGMYDANEVNQLHQYIAANQLKPKGIINTHAHIDHILGVQAVKDTYKIPFSIHKAEQPVLTNAQASAMMFGFQLKGVPAVDFYIEDGKPYPLGDDSIQVFFTPGHSPGSVSFYNAAGKWLLGGDVLFSGSIGRTDLPGGNFDTLIESIRTQLFTLPDDTVVYSGHGPATTIGNEKRSNPFLQD